MTSIVQLLPTVKFDTAREMVEDIMQSNPNWFPIGAELEITNKCNLKCQGCAQQRDFGIMPKDSLSVESWQSVLRELEAIGARFVSITGGEATLKFDLVVKILKSLGKLDLFKFNTNGTAFVTRERTEALFYQLRESGFDSHNQLIKSVMVVSVGHQNSWGLTIENAVNVADKFYQIFDSNRSILTFNATDIDSMKARSWVNALKATYIKRIGKNWDDNLMPVREFSLTNEPTLKRLNILSETTDSIENILLNFKNIYRSSGCLNVIPDDKAEIATITPRILIRPNGNIYACPGYTYVHMMGKYPSKSIAQIIEGVNENKYLMTVFKKGLLQVYWDKFKLNDKVRQKKFSISVSPCDVCRYLNQIN